MKYRYTESYDSWGTGNFTNDPDRTFEKDISDAEAAKYMQFLEATGSKRHTRGKQCGIKHRATPHTLQHMNFFE